MLVRDWLQRLFDAETGGAPNAGSPPPAPPAPAAPPSAAAQANDPGSIAPSSPKLPDVDADVFAEWDRQTKGFEPVETGREPPKPGEAAQAPKQGAAGTGAEPAAAAVPAAVKPLQQPPEPQRAAQQSAGDPQLAALQAQIAGLQAHIAQLGQQAPAAREPAPQAQRPRYELRMPPALLEAMRDEDPMKAQQAFEVMANSLAETVHQTVAAEVANRFQHEWAPQLAGQIQHQHQGTQAASAYQQDFYGTHRDLDHPKLRPVVQQVASELFLELGPSFRGYTPQVRDEIANRVRTLIHGFAGGAPLSAALPSAAAPAAFSGNGARPAGLQPTGRAIDPNSPEAIQGFFNAARW